MLKAVSCAGTSKIFEISLVYSLLPPIPCLKTFFIFFWRSNFRKWLFCSYLSQKQYICWSFVAYALSPFEDLFSVYQLYKIKFCLSYTFFRNNPYHLAQLTSMLLTKFWEPLSLFPANLKSEYVSHNFLRKWTTSRIAMTSISPFFSRTK